MMFTNKKAMLDDVFDFLALAIGAFFLLFLLGSQIRGQLDSTNQRQVQAVEQVQHDLAAINNLRELLYAGGTIQAGEVSPFLSKTKVVDGTVVTVCTDYRTQQQCEANPAKVGFGRCEWKEDNCGYNPVEEARRQRTHE